ncbi:MAG: Branched-chain amino acid transport system permease protein [Candidatus Eremiobacteraeota bacterium]|nr:Branched-chain amino acid transport system permease protein [Candidatus Eremiobacteraeota bacterium]
MRDDRIRALRAIAGPAVLVCGVALLGLALDTYLQYALCLCLVAIVVGTALVPLVGYARVVMLASGAMMGIGAYTASLLVLRLHVPFLAAVALAAVAGTLAGLVLGLPSVRFRGHHLAMVTLVFQSLAVIILREWKSLTGGAEGMRVPAATILGYQFRGDASNVVLLGAFAAVSVLVIALLLYGSFGKTLKAISSSEVGAVAFGVDLAAFKIAAFAVSCTFLSVAGAILAPRLKIIDPDSFGLMQSINALAYPVVGGMSTVWGGILGGALLRALPEALRSFSDYAELAFTGLALLIILRLPGGVMSIVEGAVTRLRPRKDAGEQPSPIVAARPVPDLRVEIPPPPSSRFALDHVDPLRVIDVSKSYGSLAAVSHVSLTVQSGKIHGLIGPNGAGKTTLFNIISGLTDPDHGQLQLFGSDGARVPAARRIKIGVSRTFQNVAIFDQLSCADNVVIGLGDNGVFRSIASSLDEALCGPSYRRRLDLANHALDVVGLYGRRNDRAGSLSLGDQRRLEVARAIVSRPRLLLLDEPVSGVNREDEERMNELLRSLSSQWNIAMLLIEHNIRFIVNCCEHLTVMHHGAVVAEGGPRAIIATQEVQQIYFSNV